MYPLSSLQLLSGVRRNAVNLLNCIKELQLIIGVLGGLVG